MSDAADPIANERRAVGPGTDVGPGLLWAVYLGVSWTWVIGMFLPVLLIRDFGPVSWFIFAVPNVLGAAAMGWALRSRDHSFRLVVNHRGATQTFSLVTIAFHLFFLCWMVSQLAGVTVAVIAYGLCLAVMLPLLVTTVQQTALAIGTIVFSLVLVAMAAGRDSLGWPGGFANRQSSFDLFALGAVCTLGFLTCPYLDLTFHRARQACRTADESKLAFGLGFGVVFLSMIVFTLLYAGGLLRNDPVDGTLRAIVGIHIAAQAVFTVGVHASALRASAGTPRGHGRLTGWLWGIAIASPAVGIVSLALEKNGMAIGAMPVGEIAYRLFMSFYGLIVPAYAWLCVHPGRGFLKPYRRELQMFGLCVAAAAPFYWLAFIHGPMQWALIGVTIIVAGRLLLDYTRRDYLAEQRAVMPVADD